MNEEQRMKLKELRKEVIDKYFVGAWREVWFFPKYKEVNGYMGTGDIFFVGLNPSSGRFPSKQDDMFYDELKNNNLNNAHITDLIKLRATDKNLQEIIDDIPIFNDQIETLRREIDILNPKLIVALGRKCEKHLKDKFKHLPDSQIKYLRHYCTCRYPKNIEHFFINFKEIIVEYNKKRYP